MIILPIIQENFYNQLEDILKTKSHKENVQFALNCAKDVRHLHNSEQANTCIELAEKWLIDENSVTVNQLKETINFTYADYPVIDACAARSAYCTVYIICSSDLYIASSTGSAVHYASDAVDVAYFDIFYDNQMHFYITELILQLKPHSELVSPPFNLNNQEEFQVALDFIQEYLHDDLLVEENGKIFFKFHPHLRKSTLNELIDVIFDNNTYRHQVTRILTKMLEN